MAELKELTRLEELWLSRRWRRWTVLEREEVNTYWRLDQDSYHRANDGFWDWYFSMPYWYRDRLCRAYGGPGAGSQPDQVEFI